MMMLERLSGQGRPTTASIMPVLMKNSSSATPMQISGMTIGSAMKALIGDLEGKAEAPQQQRHHGADHRREDGGDSAIVSELVSASMRGRGCSRP